MGKRVIMGELEMTWVVALFGIVIISLGVLGLVRPGNLIRLVLDAWQSRKGFYFSIGIRAVFGIVLLLVASQSRFPEVFRVLGIISLVAAIAAPFFGFDRLQRFVQKWSKRSPGRIRGWSVMVFALGVFLLYGSL
jgi:uncharacterized membrane protein